ncbi:MAG: hypothetical protein GY795_49570 [Desulfobacterales bacterium]|nr:hypothetical protein [Desulfobacterales bacterium]
MPDKNFKAYTCIRLFCPAEWEQASGRFVSLVETACDIAWNKFRLRLPHQIILTVRWGKEPYMEADWLSDEIEIRLPYHPAISVWLLSAYFGLTHEVGHLLWHVGPLTLREAWGHYFALYVLQALETRQALHYRRDRFLLAKDRWLSQSILKFQRHAVSPVEQATAQLTHILCKAGRERVSAFVVANREPMEDAVLLSQFSQCFAIPEKTCQRWLRNE